MTHLLDTSALLTHYLDESGAAEVEVLLAGGPSKVAVSAITWVELERRLADLLNNAKERQRVFQLYTEVLTSVVPVNADVAREAIRLQSGASIRIPLVDCLIAASAVSLGLTLVHRDQHMDGLSAKKLKVKRLPDKAPK